MKVYIFKSKNFILYPFVDVENTFVFILSYNVIFVVYYYYLFFVRENLTFVFAIIITFTTRLKPFDSVCIAVV